MTAGLGLEELAGRYRSEGDDYRAIMAKLLADRLTEAFAEALHRYARVTLWGYEREGQWSVGDLLAEKYQGIRPAFGYPSAPDHSLKADVFALMDVGTVTGMTMTESYMIVPGRGCLRADAGASPRHGTFRSAASTPSSSPRMRRGGERTPRK